MSERTSEKSAPVTGPADAGGIRRHGPFTWPQREWLKGRPHRSTVSGTDNVPVGVACDLTVDQAVSAVRALVGRHEVLRTTYAHDPSDGSGTQYVATAPGPARTLEEILRVVPEDEARDAFGRLRTHPFRLDEEWPLRVVLSERAGRVREIGVVVDHVAADGAGAQVLRRDLGTLVARAPARPDLPPVRRITQPLDLAAWERSPAGRAHRAAGERLWRSHLAQLDAVRPSSSPHAARRAAADGERPFRACRLASRGLARSVRLVASDAGTPVSTVLLTAYGAALADLAGTPAVGLLLLAANRDRDRLSDSVSNMAMHTPVLARRVRPGDLGDAARAALPGQLQAMHHGHMDGRVVEQLRDQLLPGTPLLHAGGAIFNHLDGSFRMADVPLRMMDVWGLEPPGTLERIEHEPPQPVGPELMLTTHEHGPVLSLRLAWRDGVLKDEEATGLLHTITRTIRQAVL